VAAVVADPRPSWVWVVATASVAAIAIAAFSAPSGGAAPGQGLEWLLLVGSSVHVAATGWLFTFADVRGHARQHPARYVVVPLALVVVAAALAVFLSPGQLAVLLLGYFGWQFFHYQKQNLGLASLAASSRRLGSLGRGERRSIMATGWAGIAALLLRPEALQLQVHVSARWGRPLFAVVAVGFAVAAVSGVALLVRRASHDRAAGFGVVYLVALLFPLPIFAFSSPYAAVGGMTIAHGLQYLVLVGLVAAGPPGRRVSMTRLAAFATSALIGGALLNRASHLHAGGAPARAVYGVYLGVVMAHFVVDAGIWRLRDPFPRRFLSARVPSVLGSAAAPVADASSTGVLSPA
jgi:hypothetical protein